MSSPRPVFDECKMSLRAVLLSNAGGVELNKVIADYKRLVGTHLPFRHFGYPDVRSFLEAIPDVAQ